MCIFCGVFFEILGVSRVLKGLFVDYQDDEIYKNETLAE
jgi:hypothetical protein